MTDGYSALAGTLERGFRSIGDIRARQARDALLKSKMEFDIVGERTRRGREAEAYELGELERMEKRTEIARINEPFRPENLGRLATEDGDKLAIQTKSRVLLDKILTNSGVTRTKTGEYVKPDGQVLTRFDIESSDEAKQFFEGVASMMAGPDSDDLKGWTNLRNQRRAFNRVVKRWLPKEKDLFDPWVKDADEMVAGFQKKPTLIDVWDITKGRTTKVTQREFLEGKGTRYQAKIPFGEEKKRAGILAAAGLKPEKRLRMEARVKREEAVEKAPTLKQGKNPVSGKNEWFYLGEKNKPVFTGVEIDKIDPAKKAALQMISGNLILSAKFATMPIPEKKQLIENMANFFEEGVAPETLPETGLPKGLTEKDIQYNMKKYKKTRQEVIDRYLKR